MRGSRVKALRREFKKQHGRAPERAGLARRVVGKIERFIGLGRTAEYADVIHLSPASPSEWRRVKRAWKRKRARSL